MRRSSFIRCFDAASRSSTAAKPHCPYATLGIAPGASVDAVRKQYRVVVLAAHPDVDGGDAETFKRLTAAYSRCMADLHHSPRDATGSASADRPSDEHHVHPDLYATRQPTHASHTVHSSVNGASEVEGSGAREAAVIVSLVMAVLFCVRDDIHMLKKRCQRARDDQDAQDSKQAPKTSSIHPPIRLNPAILAPTVPAPSTPPPRG